jgi:hypothetical protein
MAIRESLFKNIVSLEAGREKRNRKEIGPINSETTMPLHQQY